MLKQPKSLTKEEVVILEEMRDKALKELLIALKTTRRMAPNESSAFAVSLSNVVTRIVTLLTTIAAILKGQSSVDNIHEIIVFIQNMFEQLSRDMRSLRNKAFKPFNDVGNSLNLSFELMIQIIVSTKAYKDAYKIIDANKIMDALKFKNVTVNIQSKYNEIQTLIADKVGNEAKTLNDLGLAIAVEAWSRVASDQPALSQELRISFQKAIKAILKGAQQLTDELMGDTIGIDQKAILFKENIIIMVDSCILFFINLIKLYLAERVLFNIIIQGLSKSFVEAFITALYAKPENKTRKIITSASSYAGYGSYGSGVDISPEDTIISQVKIARKAVPQAMSKLGDTIDKTIASTNIKLEIKNMSSATKSESNNTMWILISTIILGLILLNSRKKETFKSIGPSMSK